MASPEQQPGANYGWPAYEGEARFKVGPIDESRLIRPVLTYPLSGGNCSIVAGGVYRGKVASLRGLSLYGDFCNGDLRAIRVTGGKVVERQSLGLQVDRLSSFGKDAAGEMYVTSLAGPVFRIG